MKNILIISSNINAAALLVGFIRDTFQCTPKAVETAYQARSMLSSDPSAELVMINTPLSDESGVELAEYITENTAANCMLIVKPEYAEKLTERADKSGIILVEKPFNKLLIYQLIKAVDIAVRRSYRLYQDTLRLEQKISEIKTIDKAKFLLMEYKGMTEEEAHRYLEQYAMNKRKKKNIAALELIDKINEQYL